MQFTNDATPLLIVGRQRAGTRFLTWALNRFPGVSIQGEIPNPVMENVQKLIDEAEDYYAERALSGEERHEKEYQLWQRKREQLIFSIWAYAGQSGAIEPKSARIYYGYKRPNNEFYFSFYEKHLAGRKPLYIYCIRNFVDNFLSISSRWPERGIAKVADDYLDSVAQYHRMKEAAPGRVLPFVLDRHIDEGVDYLESHIFQPLGLGDHDEILASIAAKGPVNTTVGHNKPRRRELTRREKLFLACRPRIAHAFQAFLDE
jgi:hypothetical protein